MSVTQVEVAIGVVPWWMCCDKTLKRAVSSCRSFSRKLEADNTWHGLEEEQKYYSSYRLHVQRTSDQGIWQYTCIFSTMCK